MSKVDALSSIRCSELTLPPDSHQISACARLTTLLLKATLPEQTSPPPPAIVRVGPETRLESPIAPAPDPAAELAVTLAAAATAAAALAEPGLSVNLPIFNTNAGGRPLTAVPGVPIEAAAADGAEPGGTYIGINSRMTGSKAREREVSR